MSRKKLEAEQVVVTSTTPPADRGFYKKSRTAHGHVGDLIRRDPATGEESTFMTAQTDSLTGRIEKLAASGDELYPSRERGLKGISARPGKDLFGPSVSGVTITPSAGAGCTITTSEAVTVDGEQWYRIAANATSATNNYIELTLGGIAPYRGDAATLEFMGSMGVGTIITPYLGTAAYAQFVTANFVEQVATGRSPQFHQGRRQHIVRQDGWTKNGFAGVFAASAVGDMVWTVCKIRITVPNGLACDLNFRSLRIGGARGKGTICVVTDDGYDSVYNLAAPMFESYGIPITVAVIPTKVGAAGYMTLAQLQDLVARGHSCVAHGPLLNNTNLMDAPYVSTADRLADIASSVAYCKQNGLLTADGEKCYVWPQGRYATDAGESDLLHGFVDAGYKHARSIGNINGTYVGIHGSALSPRAGLRQLWPIVGHTYAGASNTADDATETTNINGIVTQIQNLATYGLNGHLMLHKFVARGAAAAGGIEIEMDRCATLAAAIKTQMDAGKLVPVTMDQMVDPF